jgi:phosphoserine aminotransferase
LDQQLIANLETTEATPEETYEMDGKRYEVVSYIAITENDTIPGFDVQVTPAN